MHGRCASGVQAKPTSALLGIGALRPRIGRHLLTSDQYIFRQGRAMLPCAPSTQGRSGGMSHPAPARAGAATVRIAAWPDCRRCCAAWAPIRPRCWPRRASTWPVRRPRQPDLLRRPRPPDRPLRGPPPAARISACWSVSRASLDHLGLVGLLVKYSPDVGTALRSLVRYFHLHARGAAVTLTVDGDAATLGYEHPSAAERGHRPDRRRRARLRCSTSCARCAAPTGRPPRCASPTAEPADVGPYRRFFRAPLSFDAEQQRAGVRRRTG